ncbi:MAG: cupin domain-containing protein [Deltaproteobacteria bacterium]|nr:cupin domain-containing protein [Deltaproteobacteria bacterium]
MTEKELEEKLSLEGFSGIFVHRDSPNAYYPDHTHCGITAHIILDGDITVTSGGQTTTFEPGQRFDVPAGEVHSAKIGPNGCRYMIGEK